jgi:hypothetical protein
LIVNRQQQTTDNRPQVFADRREAQGPPSQPPGDGETGRRSGLGAAPSPVAPNKPNLRVFGRKMRIDRRSTLNRDPRRALSSWVRLLPRARAPARRTKPMWRRAIEGTRRRAIEGTRGLPHGVAGGAGAPNKPNWRRIDCKSLLYKGLKSESPIRTMGEQSRSPLARGQACIGRAVAGGARRPYGVQGAARGGAGGRDRCDAPKAL